MVRIRKKGVAIVNSSKGILVVAGRNRKFSLPGGGTNKGESRKKATIRELREETGLKTKRIKYFSSYKGNSWKTKNGKKVKNHAKVFIVNAYGRSRPRHEIKYISYWTPKSRINISKRSLSLIKKYLKTKNGRL